MQKIQAGQAYVELVAKDSGFRASLQRASAALSDLGAKMFAVGKIVAAAGAAMTAPFVVAMKNFTEMGMKLSKLAEQTGVSARALAELSYALDETGEKTDVLKGGFSSMAQFLDQAAQHSHAARKELSRLGLNFGELQAMSPEERFEAIAHAIGAIADPSRQAAAAMAVFGSSGDDLLPLLKNLDKLRAEAVASGMVPSKAAIEAATAVGGAMRAVGKASKTLQYEAAAAFADVSKKTLATVTGAIKGITDWVKKNQDLVSQAARIARFVAIAGAAISAVGVTLFTASTACGVLAGAITTVGAILGTLLSPLALISAGVIYGVSAWAQYTESGQHTVATLSKLFGDLLSVARETLGGIADALTAGDLELAGEIAIAGIKLVLVTGMAEISRAIGGVWGALLGKLTGDIVHGDLSSAWNTAITSLAVLWDKFCSGIWTAFKGTIKSVIDAWKSAVTWIAKQMTQTPGLNKLILIGTGVDIQDEQQRRDEQNARQTKLLKDRLAQAKAELAEAEAENRDASMGEGYTQSVRDRIQDIEGSIANVGKDGDVLGEMGASIDQQVGGSADAMNAWVDQEEQRRQDKTAAGEKQLAGAADGHEDDAEEERIALQAQLDFLRMKAAREKDAAAKDADEENDKHRGAGAGTADSIAGTFSAAALSTMGGPDRTAELSLDELRDIGKGISENNKRITNLQKTLERMGAIR